MSAERKILFVCLGNIVRSPLAEHLFRQRAEERGLDGRYLVDSAGTSSFHVGQAPDRRMRQVAAQHGLTYTGRARQVTMRDLESHDLILALDNDNYDDLRVLAARTGVQADIRRLREFDPESDGDMDVPDPYYGGQGGFEATFDIISRSVDNLLGELEAGSR
jgi:protein-tyrosine phosphatase